MRFSLFSAAIAALAIAGSHAIQLTDEVQYSMMSEIASFDDGKAATSAPEKKSEATVTHVKDGDEEAVRKNAAATIDSIRRGVLALRETKAETMDQTKGMVEKFKEAREAAEAAKKKQEAIKKVADARQIEVKVTQPSKPEPAKAENLEGCLTSCLKQALGCAEGKPGVRSQEQAIDEAKAKVAKLLDRVAHEDDDKPAKKLEEKAKPSADSEEQSKPIALELKKKIEEKNQKEASQEESASKTPSDVAKNMAHQIGELVGNVNDAARGELMHIPACESGADKKDQTSKKLNDVCEMQNKSIKAIHKASHNFKSAVETLTK